jgi:hypothetical protein
MYPDSEIKVQGANAPQKRIRDKTFAWEIKLIDLLRVREFLALLTGAYKLYQDQIDNFGAIYDSIPGYNRKQ